LLELVAGQIADGFTVDGWAVVEVAVAGLCIKVRLLRSRLQDIRVCCTQTLQVRAVGVFEHTTVLLLQDGIVVERLPPGIL